MRFSENFNKECTVIRSRISVPKKLSQKVHAFREENIAWQEKKIYWSCFTIFSGFPSGLILVTFFTMLQNRMNLSGRIFFVENRNDLIRCAMIFTHKCSHNKICYCHPLEDLYLCLRMVIIQHKDFLSWYSTWPCKIPKFRSESGLESSTYAPGLHIELRTSCLLSV